MIDWTFYIDDVQYDEPLGFADIAIRAKRDDLWHGIFFEASTNDLTFYGPAAEYLVSKKQLLGFAADVTFRAVATCGEESDVLAGKFDFRKYKKSCGNECMVTIPVEMDGCTMTLRNRYDQKVDISKNMAFDGITVLPTYDGLNFTMELTAQESQEAVEGYVKEREMINTGIAIITGNGKLAIRPTYDREIRNTINQGNLSSFNNIYREPLDVPDLPLSPQLLLDDEIRCFEGDFSYQAIFKGELTFETPVALYTIESIKARIVTWDATGDFFDDSVLVAETVISGPVGLPPDTPTTFPFDIDLSGTTAIASGLGLYAYIEIEVNPGSPSGVTITGFFEPETYFNISANKICPPTDAVVSLIHETASRITEAITDRCLTVKSDYYGRTDSEPYQAAADGCGSLRILTSGLRLRNAENPTHFMSLKDLFEGLNGIDNIGMGIEEDELRIEPAEYFYKDFEIMKLPFVPKAQEITDDTKAYSVIKVGYKKWETEGENGLDEFNSNKEYRTSLKNISNTIDITSPFVAGGYPIELTRQQSFAESGGADTKYDNDNFIICVERNDPVELLAQFIATGSFIHLAITDRFRVGQTIVISGTASNDGTYTITGIGQGIITILQVAETLVDEAATLTTFDIGMDYSVEQGNIINAANMYSPATAYNWRIRPFYNLMRWWKSVMQSYANLVNTSSKLIFSAGTGNLEAEGELPVGDPCKLESTVKAENDDLLRSDFAVEPFPMWKPDNIQLTYPMSVKDFNAVKVNPYGFISVQCGQGEFVKAYLTNLLYKPAKGEADLTLRLKW